MALLKSRLLFDQESNSFLVSLGFINTEDCLMDYSTWTYLAQSFSFPQDVIIHNILHLCSHVSHMKYKEGFRNGRLSYNNQIVEEFKNKLPEI